MQPCGTSPSSHPDFVSTDGPFDTGQKRSGSVGGLAGATGRATSQTARAGEPVANVIPTKEDIRGRASRAATVP